MITLDVPAVGWFTSSFSQGGCPNCVEVNRARDAVYIRHSRHPGDAVIRYSYAEWDAFISSVKANEFDSGNR